MAERKTIDQREKEILAFWKQNDIFKKSLNQTRGGEPFVFFEGPPTANGRPGIHHVLGRAFKDIFPRYQTMRGRFVLRKGGWDTHGLPVEVEVEKELGFSSKKEIEDYGIAKFNAKCKKSVWRYKEEWEELTERMGHWIDMDDPYITYEPRYMETLWWLVKKIHEKKLLERDYLIAPYCPRCGTTLSSHEVAQGYKTVTDPAVTVKLPLKDDDASLLVWTTTPWTLLANVAAAVHPDLDYVRARMGDVVALLAKDRLAEYDPEAEVLEEMKGSALVGREYEPPFTVVPEAEFAHTVVAAEYVAATDGTGIVHIAPFGEEDMEVIRHEELPSPIPVGPDGRIIEEASQFAGQFVKDADADIIDNLNERGLLLRGDEISHEYPFCWRCDSPLLYYPRQSWMVRMASEREELKKRNDTVVWVPEHTKEGRFGQWLEEVKDWNFSRERYWGTPLPIWECNECDSTTVIGSMREFPLDERNTFYLMRHGDADHNVDGRLGNKEREEKDPPHLTEEGKNEVKSSAEELKERGITKIVASPFVRAQETAAIVADVVGLSVETDERLEEIGLGSFKTAEEYSELFDSRREYFERQPDDGESRLQVLARMMRFIREFNEMHTDETVLLVAHGDPLWLLHGAMEGWSYEQLLEQKQTDYPKTGSVHTLSTRHIPIDADGFIDLHRPFVDEIVLPCSCGSSMQRVSEVIDVWYDSGSMPFAQWHYPFEHADVIDGEGVGGQQGHVQEHWSEDGVPRQYPADFIAEGLDQTRGWFYTMLAIATALDKETPYKAVVSHGLVLDETGQKMSKSKGNVVDPWHLFEAFGADAVRWTLVTMNGAGEPKRFGEHEVQDRARRVFDTVRNTLRFYEMYRLDDDGEAAQSDHVLDRWIVSRVEETTQAVRDHLDAWDATGAGRAIEVFIDELSNWYVRRSRVRFQRPDDRDDHRLASMTLRFVLRTLACLMAPLAPFIAEEVFGVVRVGDDPESVHLVSFPEYDATLVYDDVINEMRWAREAVADALKLRADAGISIRQPLASFSYPQELSEPISTIVQEEINVKEVVTGALRLETELTEELQQEGFGRELARNIQSLRRAAGYQPGDTIVLGVEVSLQEVVGPFLEMVKEIAKATTVEDFSEGSWDETHEVKLGETHGGVGVRRTA